MKIKYKLTANLIAASLVPVIFVAGIAYGNAKFAAVEAALADLDRVAATTAERVDRYRRQGGDESKLWSIIRDNSGLGETGEIVVARRNADGQVIFLAATQYPGNPTELGSLVSLQEGAAISHALNGHNGRFASLTNFAGQPVFAVTRFLQEPGWAVAVQVQKAAVFGGLSSLRYTLIIMGAIVLAFCIIIAYVTAVSVAVPLQDLTAASVQIAGGALDTPIGVTDTGDEISALSHAFRTMTGNLRELYEGLEEKVRERTRQLEGALQDVRKFQQAVQYSTDAIFITAIDMTIIYVNPAMESLTGYVARDMVGQKIDFFRNNLNDPALYEELFAVVTRGQGVETDELINVRKDGTQYNAEFTIYPIKQQNQIHFFVGIMNDITQRKKEERAKNEFISLASHQLRTPLTAIRWGMGRLRKTFDEAQLNDKQRHIFDAANRAARTMADTIGTMLMISRIASGKLKLQPQPTDVNAIVAELKELYQGQVESEQKQLIIQSPAQAVIHSDPALLKEVLSNLTSNAIKYSPAGKSVWLTVTSRPDGLVINVQDQGYGIPKSEQSKVFSMFFRAENVQQHHVDGTGLGLYLVYSLVTFLGGGITFASEENQGTTFSIFLPLTPPVNE